VRVLHFDCFSGISGDMTLAALFDAGVPTQPVLDSIADIAGAAIALDVLGAERISSSSVPTGVGTVKCAHGLMPIPTPGTAELLKGVPLRPSTVKAELTTPTGAAILTTVVQEWTDAPAMTIERIGCGAGTKDFLEQPNLLRVFVGQAHGVPPVGLQADTVWVLETNLDDVPGEVIGYCLERLFAAGALDAFTTPIQMKKQRPGVMLSALAAAANVSALEDVLLQETGTLGVRRHQVQRHKLQRETITVETAWGPVRGKVSWRDGAARQFSPEYDDCARIAREQQRPLAEVYQAAQRAYLSKSG
jgi:uncharacterized protein (TIGR00299 family) protein